MHPRGLLKGGASAHKALEGSETKTGDLMGGTEVFCPRRGHWCAWARKTLDMEIFLSKKSEIRPPLPSELWTLIAPKLLKIKGSFFLPIKIWEICGHLQLVSCLYLHWSLCDSILKKSFQKSPLQEVAKCLHFWNFGKSASFWLAIALKPLGQFQITRYQ